MFFINFGFNLSNSYLSNTKFSFILAWIFISEAPLDQLFPGVIGIIAAGMIVIWRDRKVSEFPEQTKKIY